MKAVYVSSALLLGIQAAALSATINFNTFVSAASIAAVEGQNNTIGFTYAGDKFVGSVYFGPNNRQLYSTNLNGGNVQLFGDPLPTGGAEVVLAGSLGQGGFAKGAIYAAPDNNIYRYAASGGAPQPFATLPNASAIRYLLFDPGSTFGGDLIASNAAGQIYRIDSAGTVTPLANLGSDTEGLDIIPLSAAGIWGSFAGDLITASEGSGQLHFISPSGVVTLAPGVSIPTFESINFIPTSFLGNPIEGYYAANYPVDIQKADASQFAGLGGDLLATSEDGVNARLWLIHYDGSAFTVSPAGNLPNQAEDGIFVTAQRIIDTGVPEPGTILLTGCGVGALAWIRRRRTI